MKSRVLVIVGPTASGKSDLAVKLAKKFNGEIISADSRQIYKGLDIGTGKITKKEMSGISHHLIDVADPKKQFTVAQYKTMASNSLRYIVVNSKLPIVVGGTGFYIDALTGRKNFPNVPPNKLLRSKLNKLDKEKLFKILKKEDPRRAEAIDPNNKLRLIRALEIIATLGSVPTLGSLTSKYKFIYIGLRPDDLEKRIYKRLIKRLPGIIREVKRLYKNGLSWKRLYELGLEYRYISKYVNNELNKKELVNKLYSEIRKYAKRQMVWFKRNKDIIWFRPKQYKEIEKYVRMALNKGD